MWCCLKAKNSATKTAIAHHVATLQNATDTTLHKKRNA